MTRTRPSASRGRSPSNWDDDWQLALTEWMDVENLEARLAAPGWVDPRVVEILRSRQSGW